MKKSKQLFENQNLMKLEALHKIEVNFFTYWDVTGVGNEKEGHVYRGITYSTTDIQRRYISIVVSDLFWKKRHYFRSSVNGMVGMEKYLFLTFKKPIESEPKKKERMPSNNQPQKKLTNKKYIMDTNAVLDLMGINLRNFSVFMQAGFTLVETGFTRSKNTGNIIMI
jgi:nitrogen regulatory protein P-II 1